MFSGKINWDCIKNIMIARVARGKHTIVNSLILPAFSVGSRERGSFIIVGINPDNCYLLLITAVQSCTNICWIWQKICSEDHNIASEVFPHQNITFYVEADMCLLE